MASQVEGRNASPVCAPTHELASEDDAAALGMGYPRRYMGSI